MKQVKFLLIVAILLMVGGLALLFYWGGEGAQGGTDQTAQSQAGGQNSAESLAKSLKESGAVLYCSKDTEECKTQLAIFGDSSQYLDYVECDAKQPGANSEECSAHQIDIYPTWVYQSEKITGAQGLAELAKLIHLNSN